MLIDRLVKPQSLRGRGGGGGGDVHVLLPAHQQPCIMSYTLSICQVIFVFCTSRPTAWLWSDLWCRCRRGDGLHSALRGGDRPAVQHERDPHRVGRVPVRPGKHKLLARHAGYLFLGRVTTGTKYKSFQAAFLVKVMLFKKN